jgi:hypothetical protein
MANDLTVNGKADGKPPTMPTWALKATANQYLTGGWGWETRTALLEMDDASLSELPVAHAAAKALCEPIAAEPLRQRLTALGMSMAPNRKPAEATMWLHEFSRLLGDLPADILCEAIDSLQKTQTFLPSVAEVRALADPKMEERRRVFSRLDAMRRYIESGQPMPKLLPPQPKPLMDRRGEPMNETETAELNQILENLGAVSRYRQDGSRYEVAERMPAKRTYDRPQMPTRQDYLDWGVDSATLDRLESEKRAAKTPENTAISTP